jgi:hypothetical protein
MTRNSCFLSLVDGYGLRHNGETYVNFTEQGWAYGTLMHCN